MSLKVAITCSEKATAFFPEPRSDNHAGDAAYIRLLLTDCSRGLTRCKGSAAFEHLRFG